MNFRRTAAVLGVIGAAAGLAGCGSGSSGVSPDAYVRSVCNAVGPFESSVASRSNALNPSTIKTPAEGKVKLQNFLAAVASDTGTALSKLRAAGTPNVSGGARIESAIVGAFEQLDSAMKAAAEHADSLPTNSPSAFQAAATSLGTTVRNSMNGIGSSLSGLKSAALQKAAASEPACKRLSAA
jgi:hypothetical protein